MYYLQAGDCDVTCPHLDDMRLITSVNDRPSFSYNRQGFVDDYMLPVGLTAKDPNLVMGAAFLTASLMEVKGCPCPTSSTRAEVGMNPLNTKTQTMII